MGIRSFPAEYKHHVSVCSRSFQVYPSGGSLPVGERGPLVSFAFA